MSHSSFFGKTLATPPRRGGPLGVWYMLVMSVILTLIAMLMMAEHQSHPVEETDEVDAPRIYKDDKRDLQFETPKMAETMSYSIQMSHADPGVSKEDQSLLVKADDFVYKRRDKQWDTAPVVVEEYKLLFFTVPKVACTTFKQLFRRMAGIPDWKSQDPKRMLPHNPAENGLKYLYNYTLEQANEFMTSPEWTRAIFVRDPKFRFLSAFLDKGLGNFGNHVRVKCCRKTRACVKPAQTSEGFLEVIQNCTDSHWDPQMNRIDPKYWQYINFVGHFEHLHEDGPELLRRIGAWEKYGKTGWGKHGNNSLFQTSAADQNHATGSTHKIWQWFNPGLERRIEEYYEADYSNPMFGYKRGLNLTKDFWIHGDDKIWARGSWDGAPIVVDKYKLIFFTIPRVGDLIWKQAFRRMEGLPDWKEVGGPKGLPHDPDQNGLTYLHDLAAEYAEQLIKNKTWTKALFVQNPKDRFLESFAFMSTNDDEVIKQCCPIKQKCVNKAHELKSFVNLTLTCKSDQWELQSQRMEPKYWEYVNFLGHIESAEEDAKKLLEEIGAWEDIGASGWGPDGKDRIFASTGNNKDDIQHVMESYTPEIDKWLEEIYKEDLENDRFAFPQTPSVHGAKQ